MTASSEWSHISPKRCSLYFIGWNDQLADGNITDCGFKSDLHHSNPPMSHPYPWMVVLGMGVLLFCHCQGSLASTASWHKDLPPNGIVVCLCNHPPLLPAPSRSAEREMESALLNSTPILFWCLCESPSTLKGEKRSVRNILSVECFISRSIYFDNECFWFVILACAEACTFFELQFWPS